MKYIAYLPKFIIVCIKCKCIKCISFITLQAPLVIVCSLSRTATLVVH